MRTIIRPYHGSARICAAALASVIAAPKRAVLTHINGVTLADRAGSALRNDALRDCYLSGAFTYRVAPGHSVTIHVTSDRAGLRFA